MMIDRIESALSMLRTDLVQRFAHERLGRNTSRAGGAGGDGMPATGITCARRTRGGRNPKLRPAALQRTLRYIDENLDSKLTWHEIAASEGVEAFGFGRSFKLFTGMTPHQYVIRCRVQRAMKLLEGEKLSVSDIALEVGCSCQSHLTTLFRKHTGTTPAAFRRAARDGRRVLEAAMASGVARHQVQRETEPTAAAQT